MLLLVRNYRYGSVKRAKGIGEVEVDVDVDVDVRMLERERSKQSPFLLCTFVADRTPYRIV